MTFRQLVASVVHYEYCKYVNTSVLWPVEFDVRARPIALEVGGRLWRCEVDLIENARQSRPWQSEVAFVKSFHGLLESND